MIISFKLSFPRRRESTPDLYLFAMYGCLKACVLGKVDSRLRGNDGLLAFPLFLAFLLLALMPNRTVAQPNILLIITDQHTHSVMSNAGNPYLSTPAMDRIAEGGIRFTKAYVTQPLCEPLRTSMQTGKYPHQTGIVMNSGQGNPDYTLIGKAMTNAGYDVAYHGKWHVAYNGPDNYETYNSDNNDEGVAERAAAFIEADRTKPFFLTASFLNPHDICQLARDLGGIPNQSLPQGPIPDFPPENELPPLPANFAVSDDEPPIIREVQAMNNDYHYPTFDYDEVTWQKYLWGYYRMVEKVDAEIKKVTDALTSSGQDENTVVIFTADHGEGVAAHGWNQKQILYDETVHIPLLISYRGTSLAGVVDSMHLVSNALDIYPTLLDFAGVAIPDHFEGYSLKPLVLGEAVTDWRDYIVAETRFARGSNYTGVSGRMIQTLDYKYVAYNMDGVAAGDQMFDLGADPGETVNLAVQPESNALTNLYINMLKDWQVQTADTDFEVPDTSYVDPSEVINTDYSQRYNFVLQGGGTTWKFSLVQKNIREVQILSVDGRLIQRIPAAKKRGVLNEDGFSSRGIYLVRFVGPGVSTTRLITLDS